MKLKELEEMFPKTHKLKPPTKFSTRTGKNTFESWEIFEYHFNEYYNRHSTSIKSDVKSKHLRQLIDKKLLFAMKSKNINIKNYRFVAAIQSIIRAYLNRNGHALVLRNIFFTTFLQNNECIDDYYKRILANARPCHFGDQTETLIWYQLIYGINDDKVRNHIFQELRSSDLCQVLAFIRKHEKLNTNSAKRKDNQKIKFHENRKQSQLFNYDDLVMSDGIELLEELDNDNCAKHVKPLTIHVLKNEAYTHYCNFCNATGHNVRDCRLEKKFSFDKLVLMKC